jgi:hypothetical protein
MKRVVEKLKIPRKVMVVLTTLVLVVALMPLYRLAMYTAPRYDDFGYGKYLAQHVMHGVGPRLFWDAGYNTAYTMRFAWQGTYSSIFMMALMPGGINTDLYWIGPVLVITAITLGCLALVYTLCRCLLGARRSDAWIASVFVTLAIVEMIHTAQQGFFWYNAAVHYTFMHGMLFLLVAVMIRLVYAEKIWAKGILFLCCLFFSFVCAGANFVTCLQGLLLVLGWGVISTVRKKQYAIPFAVIVLFYGYWLRYSLTAPGNAVRAAAFNGCSAGESILLSFRTGLENLWKLSGWGMLIMAFAIAPVLISMVKKTEYTFRFPLPVTVLSFCFYCTGWVSSFYGMGSAGVDRTWIPIKFDLQILFFVNEAYYLGYFLHRRELFAKWPEKVKNGIRTVSQHFVPYYVLLMVLVLVALKVAPDRIGSCSSYGAYYYVHSGEAAAFHQEFLNRVDTIHAAGDDVVLEPYGHMPVFLIDNDISTDPDRDENRMMAAFYGKHSIRLSD